MKKVGMISLGCTKNQVDAERMLSMLKSDNYMLSPNPEECDAVIVNTCGFIDDAKQESIVNILEMCKLKEKGHLKAVVVTGCLAERYREELMNEIPEVDVVLGIGKNKDITEIIEEALTGKKIASFADKGELSLEGERVLTTPSYFAYIKVAEGCDNRCTYCAIPGIRGDFRSRKMENIIEEAKQLAALGVKEINLVAQDTTRYGEDIYGRLMLPELLREVCKIDGVRWVRILYCYPQRVTDELLDCMANEEKIVKYMDIPLQHASGKVLKRMNRRGTKEEMLALMKKMREKVPGIVLRTTFITGFPGETEEDYEELCELVKEVKFERMGTFCYSREENTPAHGFEDQIDEDVKERRLETVMTLQMDISEQFGRSQVGRELTVLVEGYDAENELYVARSYMDAPDIDTKVYFSSGAVHQAGDFVNVKVTDTAGIYDLLAQAL